MLAPEILAEIMQHAKLALHAEIISVCVLFGSGFEGHDCDRGEESAIFFC